jgi:hypothetical protein
VFRIKEAFAHYHLIKKQRIVPVSENDVFGPGTPKKLYCGSEQKNRIRHTNSSEYIQNFAATFYIKIFLLNYAIKLIFELKN